MRAITACSFLAFAMALIVSPLSAQTPVAAPGVPADGAVPTDLQLRVVGVNSPLMVGSSRDAKGFTIEVTDARGAGVPDAAIVFRLPDSGLTGTFPDGTHASVAYTDQIGRANIANIQWTSKPGVVPIRISATRGTAHAGILVEQTLIAVAASSPALEPGVLATPEPLSPPLVVPLQQLPGPQAKLVDLQPSARPNPQAPSTPPAVTVTGGSPEVSTRSNKKWIIIAAIAVGAGVGMAMAMGGKKGSSASSTSTPTIGAPSVTVGQ